MGPSLSHVLSTGSHSASSVNLLYLAAGLLASLVAAVSVAKGAEVFRRRQPCLEDAHYQEKMAKLSFMFGELKLEKEAVAEQNHDLRNQLTSLTGALYDLKQTRTVLEKSNLSIAKENERLKTEKERLALQVLPPLVKTAAGRTKAKPKAKLPIKNAKKEAADRKPRRVSRKKK
ncbi:MAG: hypothetical protein WC529_08610 [Candidatus Margulisiibacteriota bacterium]